MEHLSDGAQYVLTVCALAMGIVCLGVGLFTLMKH